MSSEKFNAEGRAGGLIAGLMNDGVVQDWVAHDPVNYKTLLGRVHWAILEAYERGRAEEREECAQIAETLGYTYCLDPRQPFAEEFNIKLRTQNRFIANAIRERGVKR